MASEDEASESRALQWFHSNFSQVEQNGYISLRDFKGASHRSCHVSPHYASMHYAQLLVLRNVMP